MWFAEGIGWPAPPVIVSAARVIDPVPLVVGSAARGIAVAGSVILRVGEPIGFAAAPIERAPGVETSAPIGGLFAPADAFVNSLLGKRVSNLEQVAPAMIEPAVRVVDQALGETLSAPITIVSARAGIHPARAAIECAARALLRAPFRISRAPSHASRAAVRMSSAIARTSAARVVARSMRSVVPSGRSGDAGPSITHADERQPATARSKGEGSVV
jgi:hypothetical protein